MTTPLVSVIVPCFNQDQYLPEALDSVLAQTYNNWECIIVNDGSPDNTEEIAKIYCNTDKRFKYIFKENGGLSSARNTGIRNSIGEYILPLDADDKISNTYLDLAIYSFMQNPDTKLVYCKAQFFGNESGEWQLNQYKYETLLFENIIFCSAIYKRADYNKTKGYNENMIYGFEDWDFWLSLLSPNDIVYRIPEICFYYRKKTNSMFDSITDDKCSFLNRQLVVNHHEKYERYFPDILRLRAITNRQEVTIIQLQSELISLKTSKAYQLGKFILKPFSFLRHRIL